MRSTYQTGLETVREMRLAAGWRIADATACWQRGRHQAALYLSGYAVEMLLKTTCFRLLQEPEHQMCVVAVQRALTQARLSGVQVPPRPGHHLRFWRQLIDALRLSRSLPALGHGLPQALDRAVARTAAVWVVDMRYVRLSTSQREAMRAIADAGWLRSIGPILEG